jgi:hypothetical protein
MSYNHNKFRDIHKELNKMISEAYGSYIKGPSEQELMRQEIGEALFPEEVAARVEEERSRSSIYGISPLTYGNWLSDHDSFKLSVDDEDK